MFKHLNYFESLKPHVILKRIEYLNYFESLILLMYF